MKTQLSQLQQKQTFLKILIFTLVTVIVWVGLTLFRTQRETGISPELLKMAEALNPNINEEVISQIEQKRAFSPEELSDFPVYSIVTSKTGEESIVVFTASDRSRRVLETGTGTNAPATPNQDTAPGIPTETQPTENGGTVSVEPANPQQPIDVIPPDQAPPETGPVPPPGT